MHTSSKSLPANTKEQLVAQLCTLLTDLDHPKDVRMVLNSLLGTVELDVIARRLEIVRLLAKGESYATIKKDLHVSSATISSLAEAPNEKGWQKALFKLQVNDWAEGILSFFEKIWYGPSKQRTAR